MPLPILARLPDPEIAPDSTASLPLVSNVPPAACRLIGSALAIPAPANWRVPPVKTAPGDPAAPDARVQASAPEVPATKRRPLASNALPFEQILGNWPPGAASEGPVVLVVVSIVATLPPPLASST